MLVKLMVIFAVAARERSVTASEQYDDLASLVYQEMQDEESDLRATSNPTPEVTEEDLELELEQMLGGAGRGFGNLTLGGGSTTSGIGTTVKGILPVPQDFREYPDIYVSAVSDIIDQAPGYTMSVSYDTWPVDLGKKLHLDETDRPPTLAAWPTKSKGRYCVVMLDPDAVGEKHQESLLWMVVNIPGNAIHEGQTVAPYRPPRSNPFSGTHRFVFLVFEQPQEISLKNIISSRREHFSARDFANFYQLGGPIAANYFTSFAEESQHGHSEYDNVHELQDTFMSLIEPQTLNGFKQLVNNDTSVSSLDRDATFRALTELIGVGETNMSKSNELIGSLAKGIWRKWLHLLENKDHTSHDSNKHHHSEMGESKQEHHEYQKHHHGSKKMGKKKELSHITEEQESLGQAETSEENEEENQVEETEKDEAREKQFRWRGKADALGPQIEGDAFRSRSWQGPYTYKEEPTECDIKSMDKIKSPPSNKEQIQEVEHPSGRRQQNKIKKKGLRQKGKRRGKLRKKIEAMQSEEDIEEVECKMQKLEEEYKEEPEEKQMKKNRKKPETEMIEATITTKARTTSPTVSVTEAAMMTAITEETLPLETVCIATPTATPSVKSNIEECIVIDGTTETSEVHKIPLDICDKKLEILLEILPEQHDSMISTQTAEVKSKVEESGPCSTSKENNNFGNSRLSEAPQHKESRGRDKWKKKNKIKMRPASEITKSKSERTGQEKPTKQERMEMTNEDTKAVPPEVANLSNDEDYNKAVVKCLHAQESGQSCPTPSKLSMEEFQVPKVNGSYPKHIYVTLVSKRPEQQKVADKIRFGRKQKQKLEERVRNVKLEKHILDHTRGTKENY
ncbi:unnamed protein product [Darwinula stevensoni]|uniref:Uncharacterized protein n=1 Tax=Darwinula stevensoni TaxID=69355 RepID=A0A7R8WY22_9CRUS|nr:unnamed protein product [Darwinula stevensoni]CAG0878858.1 unnamed protein product [Darwinula stevensoni]